MKLFHTGSMGTIMFQGIEKMYTENMYHLQPYRSSENIRRKKKGGGNLSINVFQLSISKNLLHLCQWNRY